MSAVRSRCDRKRRDRFVNGGPIRLAGRIRDELAELDRVVQRIEEAWRRSQRSSDDYYLDSVALSLHGFYGGLERLFELIATTLDGRKPAGENWHKILLFQMAEEVPQVRPAVVSEETRDRLDAYRGFRHVVRNVYSHRFDPAKIRGLVEAAPIVFARVRNELAAFADFLEHPSET